MLANGMPLSGGQTWRDSPGCETANFRRIPSGGRSPDRPLEPVLARFLFLVNLRQYECIQRKDEQW